MSQTKQIYQKTNSKMEATFFPRASILVCESFAKHIFFPVSKTYTFCGLKFVFNSFFSNIFFVNFNWFNSPPPPKKKKKYWVWVDFFQIEKKCFGYLKRRYLFVLCFEIRLCVRFETYHRFNKFLQKLGLMKYVCMFEVRARSIYYANIKSHLHKAHCITHTLRGWKFQSFVLTRE